MKARTWIPLIAALLAGLGGWLALPAPAAAITAGDVIDKMGDDQQYGYMTGAVDMALFLYSRNGEGDKAECILNWFYRDEDSAKEVVAVFRNYKDKPAIGLLHVLMNRHCKSAE